VQPTPAGPSTRTILRNSRQVDSSEGEAIRPPPLFAGCIPVAARNNLALWSLLCAQAEMELLRAGNKKRQGKHEEGKPEK